MTNGESQFWDTTPDTGTVGQVITISICDPARANQNVDVAITDDQGNSLGGVIVKLDANGKGTKTYTLPGGTAFVTLSVDGEQDHTITITAPTGG